MLVSVPRCCLNIFKYMRVWLRNISFGSLALVVAVLIAATFYHKFNGTSFVLDNIYHSWWFIALWTVAALTGVLYILMLRMPCLGAAFVFHIAFVVVLAGALVTYMTAERGSLCVAEDAPPASMYETGEGELKKLPFRIYLNDFTVDALPDGSPTGYVAQLRLQSRAGDVKDVTVFMNDPVVHKGYRLYISGYTGNVVTLLVSYDPWGIPITYTGYLLLLAGALYMFFDRKGGFRKKLAQLRESLTVSRSCKAGSFMRNASLFIAILLFVIITYKGVCRWIESGYFPASNGVETLLLLAWCALLAGMLLRRHFPPALPYSLLLAVLSVVAVLVTGGSSSSVMPVLRTPLLGIHVAQVIIAYMLLAAMAVNAVVALWYRFVHGNSERMEQLALVGRVLLYPAVMLLLTGIFTGAVWANLSWGRYWGWDPKEVWALITMLIAAVAFHTRSLPFISKPLTFHLFCIVTFIAMLFTYFGVNYLLGGLHSYA